MFPNARVFAVEPVPDNLQRCRRTISEYGARNVEVLPYALSDRDLGVALLHLSSGRPPGVDDEEDWDYGNKSSSLLEPELHLQVHPWVAFDATIEVKTRRLDSLCAELGVDRVDFLHADVQGAGIVLEGAGDLLLDLRAIWLEVEAVPLYRDQPLARDIERYLSHCGLHKAKDTVGEMSGDQLWIRADG